MAATFLMPAETKLLVLLSASAKRFGVSRMRDYFFFYNKVVELVGGGSVRGPV